MPAILFVDDEPRVLDGLRRALRTKRHEWDMTFCVGGAEALDHLAQAPCDVVVSDMRMPGMDGAELLTLVCDTYPAVARVLLSGHTEAEAAVRVAVVGHRFLTKPCDIEALTEVLTQLTAGLGLAGAPDRRLAAASVRCLPTLPAQLDRVAELLAAPDLQLPAVIEAVKNCIGLAAKLLQLANFSFFGSRQRVTSVAYAVTSLGLPTLHALVSTDRSLWADTAVGGASGEHVAIWRHSTAAARLVRELASPGDAPYAEVAALLQGAGRLAALTSPHAARRPPPGDGDEARGANAVGAELLHLWGLPRPIVTAVAERYLPRVASPQGLGVSGSLRAAHLLLQATSCDDRFDGGHRQELRDLLAHPQVLASGKDWMLRAAEVAADVERDIGCPQGELACRRS